MSVCNSPPHALTHCSERTDTTVRPSDRSDTDRRDIGQGEASRAGCKPGLTPPPPTIASPEAELLLRCVRVPTDPDNAARIQDIVREGVDWDNLLAMAHQHAVIPLLYMGLRTACPHDVPGPFMRHLRSLFHTNAQRNMSLAETLLEVLAQLEAQGIAAVPYKGPVLTASAYGDFALRQYCDLDILVRRQDAPKARDLLISRGWEPEHRRGPAQQAAHLRFQSHYLLRRGQPPSFLEIHWRIVPGFFWLPAGFQHVWEHLTPTSLEGREFLALSPEDAILVCCVHAAAHAWDRLQWICDVARLVRIRGGPDWDRLTATARELRLTRLLALGLVLAEDMLEARPPEDVSQWASRCPAVSSLARQVRDHLFAPPDRQLKGLARIAFFARTRDRVTDRARYLVHRAVTPSERDWKLLSLPPPLFFLYYLIRPCRLALAGARTAIRQLRRTFSRTP